MTDLATHIRALREDGKTAPPLELPRGLALWIRHEIEHHERQRAVCAKGSPVTSMAEDAYGEAFHRREIARLWATLHNVREPSPWRPISTAPKDGTEVLLCLKNGTRIVGQWHETIGWYDGDTLMALIEPTHYMPLPEPPGGDMTPDLESETTSGGSAA